jgi:hypothetical protein|uniref:Uncharacterized protein n=1 Tax=Siphoviridae sp. ctvWR21 TaxID=2827966 RepID=A0A8S5TMP3_9CAUD|nr:MAG TPA: hypothetical protein [Siphoviridae sp. ctvWR21]
MFEKKTWVNRQSEHPARRRLTPTGNDNEFDVARAEGVIMEDGDAFDAETMNNLEKRVAEGFSTLDPADLGADVCVQVYACVKSGTVYELTGSGAVGRCKIPAAWNSGDTWSVNGKAVPAYCGADAVDSDCIVAGRWVLFTFDGQRLDFNGGGGLSSGKLAQATAAESDVLSGKKFYAGNKNLKTGTLALSGSAGTGDVLRGATFYKDDPKSKLTGTLALSGNANAAQVLSGYTFYKDNAKSKLTGTMANRGAASATIAPGGSYTIAEGYHNGGGRVTASKDYAGRCIYASAHVGPGTTGGDGRQDLEQVLYADGTWVTSASAWGCRFVKAGRVRIRGNYYKCDGNRTRYISIGSTSLLSLGVNTRGDYSFDQTVSVSNGTTLSVTGDTFRLNDALWITIEIA